VRPKTIQEAVDALADGNGRALGGGQSLVAAMNLGRDRPQRIVDLNRLPELATVNDDGIQLRIGALVRLATLRESSWLQPRLPMLHAALRHVAHVQVRTRATIGGNLTQADPGSEIPAVNAALGATYTLKSHRGERTVAAIDYPIGPFLASKESDELLVEVSIPIHDNVVAGFFEVARKKKDWPILGAGVQLQLDERATITDAWVGVCGAAGRPLKLTHVEDELRGRPANAATFEEAAKLGTGAADYPGARSGTAYRSHVLPVVVGRALLQSVEKLEKQGTA
jgi:carbon-monoxide dehydrogenase medium subunit